MFDRHLWQEARREYPLLLLTVAAGTAAGVTTVLQAFFISRVIHQVFLEAVPLAGVTAQLQWLLLSVLLRAGALWVADTAAGHIAIRVENRLRERLLAHVLALGPSPLAAEQTGELANTITGGIESLEAYFSHYLPGLFMALLVPLVILTAVFSLDPLSGLVLLLTAPLIPLFMWLIGQAAADLTGRQWRQLSLMSGHFLDVLQGLPTLKQLGQSAAQVENVARISERFRQKTMEVLRITFLSSLALELLATVSVAIVAVEIGLRLLHGGLSFADAFFVLVLAPEFYQPLRTLGARFHAGQEGVAAAKRIYALLATALPTPLQARPEPSPPFTIEFCDVTAGYQGNRRPALDRLSLTLPAGQTVALVGSSGAGKSTIGALLLRFLEPQSGQIRVNDTPLETVDPAAWRRQVAWVPQHPYLFNDTVAANLRLARPEATAAQVAQAAQMAGAHHFIQELPHGYETIIGEQGARLSGGQAQRLALARAFLSDAPLLILDEPAAHLDLQTEAMLQDATAGWIDGRTVLVIAHHLATVHHADNIVMLEQGQIVAQGTHRELWAHSENYRQLVTGEAARQAPVETTLPATALPPLPKTPSSLPPQLPRSRGNGSLRQLLSLLAPYRWRLALALFLGTLTIGSSIGLLATSAYLISTAALQPSIAELGVAIVGVRFFGLARGLFRYLERLVSHDLTFRLLAGLRTWFYASLEPLAPARLWQYHSGDLLNRIVADVAALEPFYVRALAPPLVAVVIAVATFLFVSSYDLSLALALLFFLLLSGVGLTWLSYLSASSPALALLQHRAALHSHLVDTIQGLADLLAYNQSDRAQEVVRALNTKLAVARRQLSWLEGAQSAVLQLLTGLAVWAILLLATPLVNEGALDGRYLAVLALTTMAAFEAVQPLPAAARYLESSRRAAGRLLSLVEVQPAVTEPANPQPLTQAEPTLAVHNLRFRYETAATWALDGLSFELPAGKRLAIVGPSGAGKSTVARLLLRFWEYDEGEIYLNDLPLRAYRGQDVRLLLGLIAQNSYLFNASIRDNIWVAAPEATAVQIEAAARQAQLHNFIQLLPERYDTLIGAWGMQLSGGQRQRLAVARTLLKNNPILILDEPATGLDPATRRQLMETILNHSSRRSLILITHQLLGLEKMDEILVLDKGQVVERGTHRQLLAMKGLYHKLWQLQQAHF